jgi:peroxiredoxin
MKISCYLFSALIFALALAGCGEREPLEAPPPPDPGANAHVADPEPVDTTGAYPAPDFTLTTLEGERFRLSEQRGTVLLVNFWATWCAPCIQEIPDLVELHEEFGPHGFAVVGISTDDEPDEVVREFVENYNMIYPVAIDDGSAADAFGDVWGLPTTYLIDANGRVLSRVMGIFPTERYLSLIQELVGITD